MHMPKIKEIGAFKIYFYSKEGLKPHVHVRHNSGVEVVIWLEDFTVKESSGSRLVDKKAIKMVTEDRDYFLEFWHEYFKK